MMQSLIRARCQVALLGAIATMCATSTALAQDASEDAASWADDLSLNMFVDSYYNFDWNLPPQVAGGMQANSNVGHRAYVRTQGFALSFLGVDASYNAGRIGAVASLRFGPSAPQFIGLSDDPGLGLEYVAQAYVTFAATDRLTLDFGQFGTIYGAEVAESWQNLNYTRGALYFLMQPFWHQGLRAGYQVSDAFGLTALVVNGVNEPFDGDRAPDLGLQLSFTPSDAFGAWIGYYGSTEPDGKTWSHFGDLVINATAGAFTFIGNADVGLQNNLGAADNDLYWGVSAAGRYAFTDWAAAALRGEYLSDADDAFGYLNGGELITGTVTLEYIPLPDENIVFRLDGRVERATDADIFVNEDAMTDGEGMLVPNTDTYVSTVLGVVIKTD